MALLSRASVAAFALSFAHVSYANMAVDFREGAPKDRFTITNTGECELNDFELTIDLSDTDGMLIFDTTGNGAGVEVFQPFEVSKGAITLISSDTVKDGDTALSLAIQSLSAGESISFTIDVDDTLSDSELGNIRVSDSEIKGGAVRVQLAAGASASAIFDGNSRAEIASLNCAV